MKLFAYGCSYTKGSELADDFLTGLSVDETEKIKKNLGNTKFNETYITNKVIDQYNNLMHQRSYAAYMSKIANVNYENRAISGSSNLEILWQITKDIQDDIVSKNDIIFIGLTSLNRYSWFDNGVLKTGHIEGNNWPNTKFKKNYILNVSNSDYTLQGIAHIHAIFNICKDYKVFYQTAHWPYSWTYDQYEVGDYIYSELEKIDKFSLLPMHCLFFELPDCKNWQKYSHTHGHPYEKYHRAFGKKLGEAIREKI